MINSKLETALNNNKFAITAELAPPKGTDFSRILGIAQELFQYVDAVNVTDFQSASVKATSLALCIELANRGIQPVLQITGRDRNRIAIQGELLSAAHFGIQNILCLTGDHPTSGDNPEAKPVFELDAIGILKTAETLMKGIDLGRNELSPPFPQFYCGAVTSPEYSPIELELIQMKKKIKMGAKFFQTQGVFDIKTVEDFSNQTKDMNTNILIGIIPLKSPGMARFMNRKVPGIEVPDNLIHLLEKSSNKTEEGIKIAADFIMELKDRKICNGVHIMAIGAEDNVLKILDKAGLIG